MEHDNDREHVGWRESLALYSNISQIASIAIGVTSFIFWLMGVLPGILLAVLVSFCLGVFFVFMLAKVSMSNNEPIGSIGTYLRTASLEPHRDEAQSLLKAQPTQRQAEVTILKEERQPSTASSQSGADDRTEPNLVCDVIEHLPAHEEYSILVGGHADGDSDAFVYGVKISNEFEPSRKVGKLSDVSAQIFYTSPDGQTLKVLRGTWLSESRYQVDFDVNHEHSLIIVGIPRRITQGAQPVFYFRREASDSDQDIKDRINGLDGDSYQIKIRLITESEGIVHKELHYKLTITREPVFKIELAEDKQQAAPPAMQQTITPAVPAIQSSPISGREAVVRALREFQVEGNNLLSQSISNPFPDESAVYLWEDRVEKFIKDNIGAAQAMEFIKNTPIHPYRGITINRELTNRINTKLHHLGRLISAP